MFKIGDVTIKNPIVIAPMAGVSNSAFRSICYNFNAGLVYSEMISDKALLFSSSKTLEMCQSYEMEHPLTFQLFGHDMESMIPAARYLDQQTACDIIDINMGCPVNKIVKSEAGSALMKDPAYTIELVKAIVDNVKKPVTVKMRLGWTKETINCFELALGLQQVGVKAIALHGRTRGQMYEGKADWEYVKKMKEILDIPVIGNGDIKTVEQALAMLEYTKCDGIMIGRGAIGNPFLIKQLDDHLQGKGHAMPSYDERIQMCYDHAKRLCDLKGERIAMKQMRGLASWYIQGMPYSAKIKNACTHLSTYADLEKLFGDYLSEIHKHQSADQLDDATCQ